MDEFLSTTDGILIFAIINAFLFFYILYRVIKAAIKDAKKEIAEDEITISSETQSLITPVWTAAQIDLQNKYDKGEITLEEYKAGWEKNP
jgi:hypothetical protein